MKHRLLPLLSIFLLIALLALPNVTTEQARAASTDANCMHAPEMGDNGQPLGLGGDDNNGPSGTTDSGDDDDTWDCIQSGDEPGDGDVVVSLLKLVLESWWWASCGLTL